MLLIVPDSVYSSSIIEFDYREIRNAGASDMQVTLYTENTVAPTGISLKREQGKKKENTIVPKKVELDKNKKKKTAQTTERNKGMSIGTPGFLPYKLSKARRLRRKNMTRSGERYWNV